MGFNRRAFWNTLKRNAKHIQERRRDPLQYLKNVAGVDGIPNHLPAEIKDLAPGTILFLPGSPGRAKDIPENIFDEGYTTIGNSREFNLYIGSITAEDGTTRIPVASMTSHMGFSSLEIAVTEIAAYGPNIETIIRVGSSGAMSENVKAGDIVAANTATYGFLTSLSRFILPGHRITIDDKVKSAVKRATERITKEEDQQQKDNEERLTVHYGTTYSKDRLYEDEFLTGPLISQVYHAFVKAYKAARGHSNSEMETAELYLLTKRLGKLYGTKIRAGSLNLVIGEVKGTEEVGYIPEAVKKGMPYLYKLVKYTTQELAK